MQIESKEITIVSIQKLTPNPKNENIHSDRQIEVLAKIIDANGFRSPLVVSNRSGYIEAGCGRYAALDQDKMLKNLESLDFDLDDFDFEDIGLIGFELPGDLIKPDDFDDDENKINNESFLATLRKELYRLTDEGVANDNDEIDAQLLVESFVLSFIKDQKWSDIEKHTTS